MRRRKPDEGATPPRAAARTSARSTKEPVPVEEPLSPRVLQHLAAAMVHDVRNPLNSMAIHLELLDSRLRAAEGKGPREGAATLARSVEVMRQEIARSDEILGRYIAAVGPPEPERRALPIEDLLAAEVERLAPERERRSVRVELVADGAGTWPVDAADLGLALSALLSNAIRASARGGTVTLRAHREGSTGVIEIEDHGAGIPAAELSKIFQIGHGTVGGRGIGLALAKQVIKGRGGSLAIRSEGPGLGSRVRVELPLDGEGDEGDDDGDDGDDDREAGDEG